MLGVALLLGGVSSATAAVIHLEMEDWGAGGQGVDWVWANTGGNHDCGRSGPGTENCSEGGYAVGWTDGGDWLILKTDPGTWTTNPVFSDTSYYQLTARMASPGTATYHVEIDGVNVTGALGVTNTGGWETWQSFNTIIPVAFTSGSHQVKFCFDTGNDNANWIELTPFAPAAATRWNRNVPADNNWVVSGVTNWSAGVPNAVDAAAVFGNDPGVGPISVTVDQAVVVGSMKFDNAGGYTIGGGSTITFWTAAVPGAIVDVVSGSHVINAPLVLNVNATIGVENALDTLTINSNISQALGNRSITKIGPGTLALGGLGSTFAGGVTISAGTVSINGDAALGAAAGPLTVNGGTLATFGGVAIVMPAARPVSFGQFGATIDTVGGDLNIQTAIAGAGGLTKINPGVLELSGINNYAGNTLVNGGTLRITGTTGAANRTVTVGPSGTLSGGGGTINSAVVLQAGATLRPANGPGVTGNLTISQPLSLDTASLRFNFDKLGGVVPVSDSVALTGVGAAGVLTLNNTSLLYINPLANFGPGKYQLFSFASRVAGAGLADIQVAPGAPVGFTYTMGYRPTNIFLIVGGPALWWNGAINNTWDTALVNTNWQPPANTFYSDFCPVNFDDTVPVGVGGRAIDLPGPVQPAGVTVDGLNNWSFSSLSGLGDITGDTALTKKGSGTLTINNVNTFSGDVDVQNGTLTLSPGATIGSGGVVVGISAWGLNIQGNNNVAGNRSVQLDGPALITATAPIIPVLSGANSGSISLAAGAPTTLTLDTKGLNPTYAGTIFEAGGTLGSLNKIGLGTQTLSGQVWLTGAVHSVTAGTLNLANNGNSFAFGTQITVPATTTLMAGSGTVAASNALGALTVALQGGTLTLSAQNPALGAMFTGFGGSGPNWSVNGVASIAGDVLTLTSGRDSTAGSAWLRVGQSVGGTFQVKYTYRDVTASATGTVNGFNNADGATFAMQNAGTNALGNNGGSLGYGGIAGNSVAHEIAIYNGGTIGTNVATNGTTGTYLATGSVNMASGNPINVQLDYNGTTVTELLTDTVTGLTFTRSYPINIATVLGVNSALLGFTGGSGGQGAIQTITNFQFSASQPVFYGNNVVVTAGAANSTINSVVAPSALGSLTIDPALTLNVNGNVIFTGGTTLTNLGAGPYAYNFNVNGGMLLTGAITPAPGPGAASPITINKSGNGALVLDNSAVPQLNIAGSAVVLNDIGPLVVIGNPANPVPNPLGVASLTSSLGTGTNRMLVLSSNSGPAIAFTTNPITANENLTIVAEQVVGSAPGVAVTLGTTVVPAAGIAIAAGKTVTFRTDSTYTLNVAGIISGATGNVATGSDVTFSALNTYTGTTTVAGGTLTVLPASKISNGALTVASGATINIERAAQTVASLGGNGTIRLGNPIAGSVTTLTVGTAAVTNKFSGTVADVLGGPAGTKGKIATTGGGSVLELASSTNSYSGGSDIANLTTLYASDPKALGTGPVTILGGTLKLKASGVPGLSQGWLINQDYNTANPNNRGIVLMPYAGESQKVADGGRAWPDQTGPTGASWSDNETWVYTGKMYLPGPTASFAGDIDDDLEVKIDGVWIAHPSWNFGTRIVKLAPSGDGWHDVEIRIHNGGGGAGATNTRNGFISSTGGNFGRGFIYNLPGTDNAFANNPGDTLPLDSGTGNLFRTSAIGPYANAINLKAISSYIQVDLEANTTEALVQGAINELAVGSSLTKTGGGTLHLTAAAHGYTGATDVAAGALVVNGNLASTGVTVENLALLTTGGNVANGVVTLNDGASLSLGALGQGARQVNYLGLTTNADGTSGNPTTITFKLDKPATSDKITLGASGLVVTNSGSALPTTINPLDWGVLNATAPYVLVDKTAGVGVAGDFLFPNGLTVMQVGDYQATLVNNPAGLGDLELSMVYNPNEWKLTLGDKWGVAANWTNGTIPDNKSNATFRNFGPFTGGTVDLEGTNRTVKLVLFDNPTASYTIGASGTGKLILEANVGAPPAEVQVANGSHSITAPVLMNSDANITAAGGTSLNISGLVTTNGGRTLNIAGGGGVTVASAGSGSTDVNIVLGGAVGDTGARTLGSSGSGFPVYTGSVTMNNTALSLTADSTNGADFNGAFTAVSDATVTKIGAGQVTLAGAVTLPGAAVTPRIAVTNGTLAMTNGVNTISGRIRVDASSVLAVKNFAGLINSQTLGAATLALNGGKASFSAGLVGRDIGGPGVAGSTTYAGGTWTVVGGGGDMWGGTDQLQFASIPTTGNFDISVRALTQTNTDGWAKAGLMARDSLLNNAAAADMLVTIGNGVSMQARLTNGGNMDQNSQTGGYAVPVDLRLTRAGDVFTGYYKATTSTTWTTEATYTLTGIGTTMEVGLAVCAHNNGAASTVTFNNLTGLPGYVPSTTYANDVEVTAVSGSAIESLGAPTHLRDLNMDPSGLLGSTSLEIAAGTVYFDGITTLRGTSTLQVDTGASLVLGVVNSIGTILDKNGPGTLTLTATTGNFAGQINVNGGTLALGGSGVIVNGNNIAVNSSATMTLGGFNNTIGTLTMDSTSAAATVSQGGKLTLGGDVAATGGTASTITGGQLDLNGARTVTVNPGASLTVNSTVPVAAGGGGLSSLIKAGDGLLNLMKPNTYNNGASAGTRIDRGTVAIYDNAALGASKAQLNGGTLSLVSNPVWFNQLKGGRLDGNGSDWNTPAGNFPSGPYVAATVSIQPGPDAANVTGNTNPTGTLPLEWVDNSTWVYAGRIWLNPQGGSKVSFVKQFDDNGLLKIDGLTVINDYNWNAVAVGTVSGLSGAGWHDFELRLGQGGGGVGPQLPWTIGFGVDLQGRGSGNQADYVYPTGDYVPGQSWFQYAVYGGVTLANDVDVTDNSTLDVPTYSATLTGTMTMVGNLINGTPTLSVTGGGGRVATVTGPFKVASTGRPVLDIADQTTLELNGAITDNGKGLRKTNLGTLYLSGAGPTSLGGLDAWGGTIRLNAAAAATVNTKSFSAMGASTINHEISTLNVYGGAGETVEWGSGSSGVNLTVTGSSGRVKFDVTNAATAVTVNPGAILFIDTSGTVELAGTVAATAALGAYVDVVNNSNATGLYASGTNQAVGTISQTTSGTTTVGDGTLAADLSAASIIQDTLVVRSNGMMRIRPTTAGSGWSGDGVAAGAPVSSSEVPEPATLALLAAAGVCLLPLLRRLRRKAA